jgi:hypothetical protein
MSSESAPTPAAEGRGKVLAEIEADVLELARQHITENLGREEKWDPGLRFARGVLEAMAYERRNADWISSVRAAAPVPAAVPGEPEACDPKRNRHAYPNGPGCVCGATAAAGISRSWHTVDDPYKRRVQTMVASGGSGFHEPDETPAAIKAAFDSAEKGMTAPPAAPGWAEGQPAEGDRIAAVLDEHTPGISPPAGAPPGAYCRGCSALLISPPFNTKQAWAAQRAHIVTAIQAVLPSPVPVGHVVINPAEIEAIAISLDWCARNGATLNTAELRVLAAQVRRLAGEKGQAE